eukprot:scaffold25803_cov129-Isochrysis_galbana.AAC.2
MQHMHVEARGQSDRVPAGAWHLALALALAASLFFAVAVAVLCVHSDAGPTTARIARRHGRHHHNAHHSLTLPRTPRAVGRVLVFWHCSFVSRAHRSALRTRRLCFLCRTTRLYARAHSTLRAARLFLCQSARLCQCPRQSIHHAASCGGSR